MPSRLIKESIWTSESLCQCSIGANNLFKSLLPSTDDYGCFDARAAVLRGKLFPLMLHRVSEKNIVSWLDELVRVDCIRLWTAPNGILYGWMPGFGSHNDIENTHSPKTPCPPWLQDEKGNDPRLPTKTKAAFQKLSQALELYRHESHAEHSIGKTPTYRELQAMTGCSMSTISKFFKEKGLTSSLQLATDAPLATDKNPNPNLNPENLFSCRASKKSKARRGKFSDGDLAFAKRMQRDLLRLNPETKLVSPKVWANEVRLMREADGRSPESMVAVWEFANSDPFWQSNILSVRKLRDKFDQLTLKMKGPSKGNASDAKTQSSFERKRSTIINLKDPTTLQPKEVARDPNKDLIDVAGVSGRTGLAG